MKTNRSRTTRPQTAATKTAVERARKTASNSSFFSHNDPNGSYTGTPSDGRPVQDADDL